MYLNAFLVSELAEDLNARLSGSKLINSFSTGKYEIYLLFDCPLALRIQFYKGEAFFQEVQFNSIPKSNRQVIFDEAKDQNCKYVRAKFLDRLICIQMEQSTFILYLYGKFSQMALYDSDKKLLSHFPAKSRALEFDFEEDSPERVLQHMNLEEIAEKFRFLKSDDIRELELMGFGSGRNNAVVWEEFCHSFHNYSKASIIDDEQSRPKLIPGQKDHSQSILSLLGEFTRMFIAVDSFRDKKAERLRLLEQSRVKLLDRKRKLLESIKQVEKSAGYKEKADLIMANLHQIPKATDLVTLNSFIDGKPVRIKLKPELSPQANAERLYRKSKNEGKRLHYLEDSLQDVKTQLTELEMEFDRLESADDHRDLRKLNKIEKDSKPAERVPYKRLMVEGFEVRVGKSARDNDELLSKYSSKDDLWFHAHAVSGSHVLLRRGKNQDVPLNVIELVASIAALNSRSRHESLAAVIYTERKYVRKPRKAAPGAVLVENEKLIMVEPKMLNG